MSSYAISVRGLGKKYRISHGPTARYKTLRESALEVAKLPLRAITGRTRRGTVEEFWALKDLSFDVTPGEVVGVIGRNGAGKSTLLKVLSRITDPTEGEIALRGRVASLLEVGAGFHPELTGRENIFLNGAILGMGKSEIARKLDSIVAFAEVERFLDTPVKRYSSGMYTRLAFSVAAHLEPDVLVVDEVLAVGDTAFQKKCLGRMGEVAADGRTVLFVSHSMSTVAALCETAIVLNRGRLEFMGPTTEGVKRYLEGAAAQGTWRGRVGEADTVELTSACVRDASGASREHFENDEAIVLELELEVHSWPPEMRVGFELVTAAGVTVLRSCHNDASEPAPLAAGVHKLVATIPPWLLNHGDYYVTPVGTVHGRRWVFREEQATRFAVSGRLPNSAVLEYNRPGVVAPLFDWAIEPGP